jgi:ABC-type sugar transport system ATPase subunit
MSAVDLDHVTVGSGGTRLSEVSMAIDDGALVAVVGASGSGKTSLLRAVAGLDWIDRGAVRLDGRDVTRATPGERDVGMVFQTPALIGHFSARRNVSFPLDVRRMATDEIRRRVDAEARALHIEQLMHREPATLSAGEQQMVQIARALVRQSGYQVTTLMTTNDSADVESLAGMVAVLDGGRLVQFGDTAVVRRLPVNLPAAVATGPLSLIEMTVVGAQQGFWLQREDPAGGELIRIRAWSPALADHVGTKVTVGLRPEDVEITDTGRIPATIRSTAQFGGAGVACLVAGVHVGATVAAGRPPAIGSAVRLRVHHHVVFDRSDDRRIG